MSDMVNHPAHYDGEIECKDAMIQQFGEEEYKIFCKLNAFKYLWRANKKHDTPDEDLAKADWYLQAYADTSLAAYNAQEGPFTFKLEEVSIGDNEPIVGHFKIGDWDYGPSNYEPYTEKKLFEEMKEHEYRVLTCQEDKRNYGLVSAFVRGECLELVYTLCSERQDKVGTKWEILHDDMDGYDPDCDEDQYLLVSMDDEERRWIITPAFFNQCIFRSRGDV